MAGGERGAYYWENYTIKTIYYIFLNFELVPLLPVF
jgi:hypothetical protein